MDLDFVKKRYWLKWMKPLSYSPFDMLYITWSFPFSILYNVKTISDFLLLPRICFWYSVLLRPEGLSNVFLKQFVIHVHNYTFSSFSKQSDVTIQFAVTRHLFSTPSTSLSIHHFSNIVKPRQLHEASTNYKSTWTWISTSSSFIPQYCNAAHIRDPRISRQFSFIYVTQNGTCCSVVLIYLSVFSFSAKYWCVCVLWLNTLKIMSIFYVISINWPYCGKLKFYARCIFMLCDKVLIHAIRTGEWRSKTKILMGLGVITV